MDTLKSMDGWVQLTPLTYGMSPRVGGAYLITSMTIPIKAKLSNS